MLSVTHAASVTLSNGAQRIAGEVVGKDAETDLAVIRTTESVAAKPLDAPATRPHDWESCVSRSVRRWASSPIR